MFSIPRNKNQSYRDKKKLKSKISFNKIFYCKKRYLSEFLSILWEKKTKILACQSNFANNVLFYKLCTEKHLIT